MNALESALFDDLTRDEGRRNFVYDDATGQPIKKGDYIHGYPTIGVGRNLSARGLSDDEINYLLSNDISDAIQDCIHYFKFWADLSPIRQRVLANMVFNMGIGRVIGFKLMLAAIAREDWMAAYNEMLSSVWAQQTGNRARRLAVMMRDNREPSS